MAIPEISARFGSTDVTTQSGQPVSLFINYMPATPRELKGMRVADCARVEYLESPTDPRFQGATYVINFIMQVYEYGGYTKLSANQLFPSMYQNNESLFSRLTYRKMTFDLSAAAYNVINNHTGSSQYAVMRLTDNDEKEFLLHRDETLGKSRMKSNYYPISFQATYISPKIQFRNTLSYAFTSYPVSERSGQLTYTPLARQGGLYIPFKQPLARQYPKLLRAPQRDASPATSPYRSLHRSHIPTLIPRRPTAAQAQTSLTVMPAKMLTTCAESCLSRKC